MDEENSGGGSISNFTASIVSISSDHADSTSCFETKRRSRRKLEALGGKTVLGIKNDQTTEKLLKVRDLTLNRMSQRGSYGVADEVAVGTGKQH